MNRRLMGVFAVFLAVDSAFAIAACSSSSDAEPFPDASTEGSTPDSSFDAPTSNTDARTDAGGHCSAAMGPCDIVAQDCPNDSKGSKQECVIGNGATTQCIPVQGSQQLGVGRACCAGANGNPCLPGLTCVGGDNCVDGGPQVGRCAPACCRGDDKACGKSVPEGISGACDTLLTNGDASLNYTCSYSQRCEPFQQEPCKADEVCHVEDVSGSASCFHSNGKVAGQSCMFSNDCADGLVCLDPGICFTACLLPGSMSPFDASVAEQGPGKGGCPPGKACTQGINGLPTWYYACVDGG